MNDVVMISGKQRSGKDTLALHLVNAFPRLKQSLSYDLWRTASFANPMKQVVNRAVAVFEEVIGTRVNESHRAHLMQLIGTEWARHHFGQDVWVNARKRADEMDPRVKAMTLITDCRFRNEFHAYPQSLRVRLTAPEHVRKARSEGKWRDNTSHPSEVDLDDYEADGRFDLVIDTERVDAKGAAELVIAQLLKRNWIEKRNHTEEGTWD